MGDGVSLGNQSLTHILLRTSLLIISTLLILSVCAVISFILCVKYQVIYPANAPEQALQSVKEQWKEKEDTATIPTFYQYKVEDQRGNIVINHISNEDKNELAHAKQVGVSKASHLFAPSYYHYVKGEHYNLYLSYQLRSDFYNPFLKKVFPNAEVTLFIVTLLNWIVISSFIIRYYSKKLKRDIITVEKAIHCIQKQQLNFKIKESGIKEFQEILKAINLLKQDLATSLREEWKTKEYFNSALQSISHDIRTPVTLISGNLELLAESIVKEKRYVMNAQKGVRRLDQYIEELSMISRLTSDQKESATMIDEAFLEECIELAENMVMLKGVCLKILCQDCNSEKKVDARMIYKALENILMNALRYSKKGDTIFLSFQKLQNSYEITVQDEGGGFSAEALQRAKERFFTSAYSRRENDHSGLGLSIVSDIAKAYHGRLELDNAYSHNHVYGACVTLRLFSQNK